ncbi:GntR family transcriptional regulator [Alkalihalophilus lindianensis]|uniref:GntR family transcriptional regulator n=2 Tax=Alkalihalophilus lindianensis TaxID=1630542 RepID=A0ABU3X8H0_9BACI|nr:GntR family transcriptional regulator [Alkalihalophilus lindianensis]MDV2684185.1 GntR family transcriptional regulator [Alkalihalophilus lindianensis]
MMERFDDSRPIFLQIAEQISDHIIHNELPEGTQAPSTNQFAKHYQINPATAAKGINLLVDKGILFKRRGVGMFVAEGAREQLLEERRQKFNEDYIVPLLHEAEKLQLSKEAIIEMISKGGN